MADLHESTGRTHREVWDLLPWLANDTLSDIQVHRCQKHIEECAECRNEFRAQQTLREQIRCEEAVVHTPHAGLRKLMTRIDHDEIVEPATEAARPDSRRTRWLAAAVVVQTFGLIGLAGYMSVRLNEIREAPRYSTLSSTAAPLPQGPAARVVFFSDSLSVSQLNELLRAHNAQIVSGPNSFGVYTLVFPGMEPEAVAAAVEKLGEDSHVRFAEPDLRAHK